VETILRITDALISEATKESSWVTVSLSRGIKCRKPMKREGKWVVRSQCGFAPLQSCRRLNVGHGDVLIFSTVTA
jgi:hypothetical protein